MCKGFFQRSCNSENFHWLNKEISLTKLYLEKIRIWVENYFWKTGWKNRNQIVANAQIRKSEFLFKQRFLTLLKNSSGKTLRRKTITFSSITVTKFTPIWHQKLSSVNRSLKRQFPNTIPQHNSIILNWKNLQDKFWKTTPRIEKTQ